MACNCRFRKTIRNANVAFVPERTIYLDNNATTRVDPSVLGAFDAVCRREWGNPSSLTSCGTQIFDQVEEHRKSIASSFGCREDGIHFCSSGSEAIHAALLGLHLREPDRAIVTTIVEHSAVYQPARHLKASGRDVTFLPVNSEGVIDTVALENTLARYNRSMLVYSPVHHETGAIQPIRAIAASARKHDCIIILDAVQAAARLLPEMWSSYCDMFALSGHKLYAPKGIALLYKRPGLRIRPTRFGGHQEDGLFPGTENTPGIAALASAIVIHKKVFHEESMRLSVLADEFLLKLEQMQVTYHLESPADRAPGVLCISLPGYNDMEKLVFGLNNMNICISRFSACTARINGPSRVLSAMGRSLKRSSTSLRISCGRFNRREDLDTLARAIARLKQ
jgi:cysteine desulfurase